MTEFKTYIEKQTHRNTYKQYIRKPDTKIKKLIQKTFTEIMYGNMCRKILYRNHLQKTETEI